MSKFTDEFGCSKRAIAGALRASANGIDRYGWRQNTFGNKYSGFCAVGALLAFSEVSGSAFMFMCRRVHTVRENLTEWNDGPNRTKEQVTGLFRETAGRLEHGEFS